MGYTIGLLSHNARNVTISATVWVWSQSLILELIVLIRREIVSQQPLTPPTVVSLLAQPPMLSWGWSVPVIAEPIFALTLT